MPRSAARSPVRDRFGQLAERAILILHEQAENAAKRQRQRKAVLVIDIAALRYGKLEPRKCLSRMAEDQQVPAR